MEVTKVQCFKTSDGKLYESESQALEAEAEVVLRGSFSETYRIDDSQDLLNFIEHNKEAVAQWLKYKLNK